MPVFKLNADGTGLTPVHAHGTSTALTVEAGTRGVFLNDTTSRPNELFALEADGQPARQLTHFNDEAVARLDLGKVEEYWFDGARRDIHGWLVYPPGYDRGEVLPARPAHARRPAHDGARQLELSLERARLRRARLRRDLGQPPRLDRLRREVRAEHPQRVGRQAVRGHHEEHRLPAGRFPNIDPNRMAAAGASYGGYMAAWVLGHTDRFRCIINHAGVNNSYSQFATDVPHGFAKVMGGTPWENVEGLQRNNPMFYAKNFKTPMLDHPRRARLPRALRQRPRALRRAPGDGTCPSRLVVFPNENHWVLSPQNSIYWH